MTSIPRSQATRRPRFGRRRFAGVAILLALAAAGLACSTAEPELLGDNPFDPNSPNYDPDPFKVQATFSANLGRVDVTWTRVDYSGIRSYEVLRSAAANGPYLPLETVDADEESYRDTSFFVGTLNFYKIRAVATDGSRTSILQAAPASVWTQPVISINDGAAFTGSRFVSLAITAAVDSTIEVSNDMDFTAPFDTTQESSTITIENWDLGPATSSGEAFTVYMRMDSGDGTFLSAENSILNQAPALSPLSNAQPHDVVTLPVVVSELAGITQMRAVASPHAVPDLTLLATPWGAPTDSFSVNLVTVDSGLDCIGIQYVHAEFDFDFGYREVVSQDVATQDLAAVTFTIRGVNDDVDGTTNTHDVLCEPVVGNSSPTAIDWVRFSEDPSFAGVAFEPYVVGMEYPLTLSAGFGEKIVYGGFKNLFCPGDDSTTAITVVDPN